MKKIKRKGKFVAVRYWGTTSMGLGSTYKFDVYWVWEVTIYRKFFFTWLPIKTYRIK